MTATRLFFPRNRGILLDIAVFIFQLFLIRLLTRRSIEFTQLAEQDTRAKVAIGVFLIALFVLQPVGPILKRWSFHKHFPSFEQDQGALLSIVLMIYRFFYIGAMWIMIYIAVVYFASAFPNAYSDSKEKLIVALGLALPILAGFVVFRYFKKPAWDRPDAGVLSSIFSPIKRFLKSPSAEILGDLCMFLNIVCFQVLFGVYVASPHFWNALHKTTRVAQSNFDGVFGRVYLAMIAVVLVYLPARIFYLAIDKHRKSTWVMMLLANLPLILAVVFYTPQPQTRRPLQEPDLIVTAAELHREYETDYQANMKKYLGRVVNVSGRVQTRYFPRSLELNDEIGLDGSDGYPWVYCSFDEDQVDFAERLELGDQVILQCVGGDRWSSGARLEHCVVVSKE